MTENAMTFTPRVAKLAGNVWTTSPADQRVASPALWAHKPYWVPFVVSLRGPGPTV